MVKLCDLTHLEKQSTVDVRYCQILWDDVDEEKNRRRRILEQDGRYFLHEMIDGEVTACFEVAVDWRIKPGKIQFAFTPDDRHVYYFRQGQRINYSVRHLDYSQIGGGDSCSYNGMTVEFVHDGKLMLNEIPVAVQHNMEFTYKLRTKRIEATGAARGLYIFLEHIAEEARAGTYPCFSGVWELIFNHYGAVSKK